MRFHLAFFLLISFAIVWTKVEAMRGALQQEYEARMAHSFTPVQADHAGSPTTPTSEARVDQGSQPSSGIDTRDVVQLPDQPPDGPSQYDLRRAEARAKVARADEALKESRKRGDPEVTINARIHDKMQALEQQRDFELFREVQERLFLGQEIREIRRALKLLSAMSRPRGEIARANSVGSLSVYHHRIHP